MEQKIYELGVLPVIKIEDADNAKPLAQALIEGDLPAAEVTFRTKAAKAAIKAITSEFPEMLVGAGTVLTTQQVDEAVDAGAKFVISPGLNPKVVEYCTGRDIPVYPGVNNPSQIEQAIELGLKVVKFFPAEPSGGLNMLKAMSAPYSGMKFMPTGGINAANIEKYLDFNKIIACGGSWMVPEDLLAAKDFGAIKKLASEAVQTVLGFRLAHLGINTDSAREADDSLGVFKLFGERVHSELPGAYFTQNLEIMDHHGIGANGHIGYTTNNMDRALAYFRRRGIDVRPETVQMNGDKITFAYLTVEAAGFGLHIRQK